MKRSSILRSLIRELSSPVGDSRLEMMSDVDEVCKSLNNLSLDMFDFDPSLSQGLSDLRQEIDTSQRMGPRSISSSLTKALEYLSLHCDEDTQGLQMRIMTLLRRLPMVGSQNPAQSALNPPFDPSKAGRFNTT